jgi:hypothetical protein
MAALEAVKEALASGQALSLYWATPISSSASSLCSLNGCSSSSD